MVESVQCHKRNEIVPLLKCTMELTNNMVISQAIDILNMKAH